MSDSPVSVHNPTEGQPQDEGPSAAQQKQMEQVYAQMKRKCQCKRLERNHTRSWFFRQGGVGKSTVSTGLALSLAQQGHKVEF